MDAKSPIRQSLELSNMMFHKYVDDLDDEAFRMVPVAGMNPIALQVGHLISVAKQFVELTKEGSLPPLPAGFDAGHNLKEPAGAAGFKTKDEYVALWDAQQKATLDLLGSLSDEALDQPGPEKYRSFTPTVGAVLNFVGLHALGHFGQFVAVRRALKKPIAF